MNRSNPQRYLRCISLETLEARWLLDAGLGTEIAEFASELDLTRTLVDRAVAQYEWMFNTEVNPWRCEVVDFCPPEIVVFDAVDAVDPAAPSDGAGAAEDSGSFSETNVQVAGVDEGDLVETDGNYVYVLSDQSVAIIDVQDPSHPRVSSRVQLDPNASGREMYLHDDRLLVLSSNWYYEIDPLPIAGGAPTGEFVDGFSTDALWAPTRSAVVATVIDVSDREDAAVVSQIEIDGSLSNSRSIDGTGFLIVDDYLSFPRPLTKEIVVQPEGELPETLLVYESEEEYRARVWPTILEILPTSSTYDSKGVLQSSQLLAGFDDIYRTPDPNFQSLVSVVTIDWLAETPIPNQGTTVMTNTAHEIYMSQESLYLFQTKWGETELTSIMQFAVDTDQKTTTPIASGQVNGHMLDQFSADERDGLLRVATTTGFGRESSSGVYVLDAVEDDLTIIGYVDELALGEQIFSARFLDSMAYIVTFRQVDPLFAISLADPQNPTVEGELKIPGFSEYLQPIDGNHLLAIGRDADPITGRTEALQISLFNVADATAPELVDRYTFESDTAFSPAEHDHHAFGYYPEYHTLAIPVTSRENGVWIREENGEPIWVPAEYNENLQMFTVDVESGIDFLGAVDHPSAVRRSLRIDDAVYSVSFDTLKINSIIAPATRIGNLYYLPPLNGGVVPVQPTVDDLDRVFEQANSNENNSDFDMDGNSLVNVDDAAFMVEAVFKTFEGDTDLDGDVDFTDFLRLAASFGQEGGWGQGDFDGDRTITMEDFLMLSDNYGNRPTVAPSRFRG